MKCPDCQQVNREGAKFCKYCGAVLAAAADVFTAPVAPAPAETPSVPPDTEATPSETEVEPVILPTLLVGPELKVEAASVVASPMLPVATELDAAAADVVAEEAVTPFMSVLSPLPITIADRYELISVVEQSARHVIYRAYDHGVCGQCGAERADRTDAFCWQCGAELGSGAVRQMQVGQLPEAAEPTMVVDGVTYWITNVAGAAPTLPPQSVGLRLHIGYATDPGSVREMDEDSLLVVAGVTLFEGVAEPGLGLFAVADGMGGHDDGQLASRRVIEALVRHLLPEVLTASASRDLISTDTLETHVIEAVTRANAELAAEAQARHTDMGSTLTLALIYNQTAIIANVGDSRTYVWHDSVLSQVTEDHSVVARLLAQNLIQPEDIYTYPHRNKIYRVLGDKPDVEVDVFRRRLFPGDHLVLCCDGVWEMIRTEGIEEVLLLHPTDPQAACDEIIKRSNIAGGTDNISAIVVEVR